MSATNAPFSEDAARRVLDAIDPGETIAFLQSLIRMESVNPPGDVRQAIALCETMLTGAGFACRVVPHDEIKPNLIAEFGASGPRLTFNAHVDVVPTGDLGAWNFPPFAGVIDGGRVYGRGAGDDKGSVTAQVMAGVALARSGVPPKGTLIVNEVADEEVSGAGAVKSLEALQADGKRLDFVIVGEQTLGRVAIGEKGYCPIAIEVTGRAAHGALPWEGANALVGMARAIVAIEEELQPRLRDRTHPQFHHSSASVNLITGGVKANVVPDRCEIYVDRRLAPGEDPQAAVDEMDEIVRRAVAGEAGLAAAARPAGEMRRATLSDPDSPLVQAMQAANRYLGLSDALTGFSMASDGRFFAAAGIPTIIYGPGDPRLAHVPDEWVGVDEVLDATRAYALAALGLLGG
ncbi:MAG: M20 family metallopeptidase [Thermomicrobiales bacterium]|nr:M20 family metallopeptidase [Thermomicrobiales bacterium]